jgi:hypothetical protein
MNRLHYFERKKIKSAKERVWKTLLYQLQYQDENLCQKVKVRKLRSSRMVLKTYDAKEKEVPVCYHDYKTCCEYLYCMTSETRRFISLRPVFLS